MKNTNSPLIPIAQELTATLNAMSFEPPPLKADPALADEDVASSETKKGSKGKKEGASKGRRTTSTKAASKASANGMSGKGASSKAASGKVSAKAKPASPKDASASKPKKRKRKPVDNRVTHIYNPLNYAWDAHAWYLNQWGKTKGRVIMMGMNPGPWGMAQNGIPFGSVPLVRDWLGLTEDINKPKNEHPARPIEGLACAREEVSGARLWGWAKDRYKTPDAFFEHFFVYNFCPLVFMAQSGRNVTPDKLPKDQREALEAACRKALRESVLALEPKMFVGIGAYAETMAKTALEGIDVRIERILHPSPASPIANRGWADQAEKQLKDLGLIDAST